MSVLDKMRKRSLEEWVAGTAVTYTATKVSKTQWRRGLRNVGAASKGSGRMLHASYRTMQDFARANKIGNKPFSFEPMVPGAIATSIYVATPVAMVAAAVKYPLIAGPAQSTAATGQIGIGSRSGQLLISGNLRWRDLLPW